jgi:hypothetical protein
MSSQTGFDAGGEVIVDCGRYCRGGCCTLEDDEAAEYGRADKEIGGTGGADDVLLLR